MRRGRHLGIQEQTSGGEEGVAEVRGEAEEQAAEGSLNYLQV